MTPAEFLILGLAGLGAGGVNALAGGGTLISFPVLLALGMPPVIANVTNAVALCPGYLGATLAQRRHLIGRQRYLWACVPAAISGGLIGAAVLLHTHERTFQVLVPYMLVVASALLAIQERVRARVAQRASTRHRSLLALGFLAVLLAGIYGGFFSAGMSVILLAVVALTIDDSFTQLNALKQVLAFCVNVAAALLFAFSGRVLWAAAAVVAVGALCGGILGGRLAQRLHPIVMRWIVVSVGFALAIYYWVKG